MAFFKFRPGANASTEESANGAETQTVENLRRRARQRLIGAAVLVVIAVAGFPMVFDTQPRPVPVDLTIDIPAKNRQASEVPPAALQKGSGADLADASTSVAGAPPVSDDPKHALSEKEELVTTPAQAAASTAPAVSEAKPEPAKGKAELAKAKPEKKDVTEGRYVVQVGAFLEESKVRETRAKLEKAGLKTYTQVIDAKDGKRTRVRLGPFATKAEADKAADKAKSLQMQAMVLSY